MFIMLINIVLNILNKKIYNHRDSLVDRDFIITFKKYVCAYYSN